MATQIKALCKFVMRGDRNGHWVLERLTTIEILCDSHLQQKHDVKDDGGVAAAAEENVGNLLLHGSLVVMLRDEVLLPDFAIFYVYKSITVSGRIEASLLHLESKLRRELPFILLNA